MQHVLSHTLSPVSVGLEAEEPQDLSVVVQKLAQSIQLLIGSQWLHGRRRLHRRGGGRGNGKLTLNTATAPIQWQTSAPLAHLYSGNEHSPDNLHY